MADYSNKNPYSSKITANHILNGQSSKKETRHIVFDLGDSGLEYKAGDALGVIPITSPELIDDVIAALGANPDCFPKSTFKNFDIGSCSEDGSVDGAVRRHFRVGDGVGCRRRGHIATLQGWARTRTSGLIVLISFFFPPRSTRRGRAARDP